MVKGESLRLWLDAGWQKILGYIPRFHLLFKGCIFFQFNRVEDTNPIIDQYWLWGPSSLVLSHWKSGFDPCREPMNIQHIWARFPIFLLELWSNDILSAIGSNICSTVNNKVARVLVEVDIRDSFLDKIEIIMGNLVLVQPMDFWKVSFHCLNFHEVSHLWKECSDHCHYLHPKKKVWKRKDTVLEIQIPLNYEAIKEGLVKH